MLQYRSKSGLRFFILTLTLTVTFLLPVDMLFARGVLLPDFAELVRQNKAAVVNISTDATTPLDTGEDDGENNGEEIEKDGPGQPGNDPFKDFIEDYQKELPSRPNESLGSGFVLTADGYILTCAHVIEDANQVIVKFSDRKELEARVVGADRRSDVAVLKVEATELSHVDIGDPESLDVGDWVLAIGSPFGFDSSATSGIVSAKGRSLPNESYVPFIQTDVAINPGNSGGPLFDLDGRVVGINAQIYSRTGGFMGLSFAVPIDLAIRVSNQLRETGQVKRGWLGVEIQEVTADLAKSMGMDVPTGALVTNILKDGPAAESTIIAGDVILAFNGTTIGKMSELPPVVGSTPADSVATIDVMRDGESIEVDVELGELPNMDNLASTTPIEPSDENGSDQPEDLNPAEKSNADPNAILGLTLALPTPAERRTFQLPTGGLIVKGLGTGPGMRAGLKEGDILLRLGPDELNEVAQFQDLVAQLSPQKPPPISPQTSQKDKSTQEKNSQAPTIEPTDSAPLMIRRGPQTLFVPLTFE